ncbi:MAG TPA: tryptophanase, partial [Actinomycetota bacterium]
DPYRSKVVEPIPLMPRGEREVALAGAHYNLFDLRADQVTIDLLSDSGTGALSAAQLAAAMTGDESDAGARSFHLFRAAVQELTSCEHILPVRQGRAAERILFTTLLEPGQITLSNTHFDTTRGNVELAGGQARDLDSLAPFKGDVDLEALEHILDAPDRDRVALVIVTITNNGGGQPMSMGNLAAVSRICQERRVPLFLDAARFAENAWLVTQWGPEFRDWSPREVAEAAFRLANGCVASMKKGGLVNMGGFLALSDEELARRCELLFIATDGSPTDEGLAGRDLDMLAQGLVEVTDPDYLRARADMARHLADLARVAGVAIVEPLGIHAIYLSAERLLPHLPPHWFPGHALACELYLEGGIRSAELGLLYVGEEDGDAERLVAAPYQLVWLAIPRRVYTQTHIEYTGRILARFAESAERIPGYHIVGSPAVLWHFRAKLEPVPIPPSRLGDRHLSCHPDEGARNPVRWGRPFCSVPTGTPRAVPRGASHHRSTPLHLAVSCYLVDRDGRLLIAQRAHVKATGASVRTNSCCGDPAPRDPCANPYAAMPAPRSVWMSRARP